MSFRRFVEIGRVCLINYGPDEGKLCVIVDVLDHTRAFVDGPSCCTGVQRQTIPFKRLSLTDFKLNIGKGARLKTLKKQWEKQEIQKKWDATSWAKKRATRNKRASLNDFERFKVMVGKKQRSYLLRHETNKLLSAAESKGK
eukprot:TRINITY_DN321_c0_g1_i2.p1 TRINITY_DN321_c0_g1~~TRINITY_DN321_c0_g1_i2.p1  ORF type:complete len:142 (+),score=23.43 TRINITY_DN321_c0_g1_i2:125-550(+)